MVSSPATKHRAVWLQGEQEHKESSAAGLKWKAAGEALAIEAVVVLWQEEGWLRLCACRVLSGFQMIT